MNNRRVPERSCDTDATSSAVLPAEMPAERGEPPVPMRVDGWIVRPDTADRRKRGRGSARRTETMAQQLTDLVEQFCNFQRKQRGKTEGGVRTYRWILEQFLIFVRNRYGRLARVTDLTSPTIQEWMDDMAGADLALSTMRVRQSTLSSFCAWLVKRDGRPTPWPSSNVRPTTASRRSRSRARPSWMLSSRRRRPAVGHATWRSS